jgi:hypothetical protein
MSNVLTQIDGQMIARNVEVREKALRLLRDERRPSSATIIVTTCVVVTLSQFGLGGLHPNVLSRIVISVACGLSYLSLVNFWTIRRQLRAITDLLLLDAAQSR